jgi:hypothetical protein
MRAGRLVVLCVAGVLIAGCTATQLPGATQTNESQFSWWISHGGWWNTASGPVLSAAQRSQPFCSDAKHMYEMTEYLSTHPGSLGVSKAAQRLDTVYLWANAAAAKAPTPALNSAFENYAASLGLAVSMGLAIDLGHGSQAFSGHEIGRVPTRQNLLMDITNSGDAVATMHAFLAENAAVCRGFHS